MKAAAGRYKAPAGYGKGKGLPSGMIFLIMIIIFILLGSLGNRGGGGGLGSFGTGWLIGTMMSGGSGRGGVGPGRRWRVWWFWRRRWWWRWRLRRLVNLNKFQKEDTL